MQPPPAAIAMTRNVFQLSKVREAKLGIGPYEVTRTLWAVAGKGVWQEAGRMKLAGPVRQRRTRLGSVTSRRDD